MMTHNAPASGEATSIWDKRYETGDGAVAAVDVRGDPLDYTSHPMLWKESIAMRVTGSRDGDPNLELGQRHFSVPARKMLAIGSGLATVEEWFVSCGFVEHCLAFEASEHATKSANERIAANGLSAKLEVRCGDPLKSDLPDGSFDVVLVQAAIHHFFEIEDMFKLMHRVLKPGGLLVYDEYVGPNHLLFDDVTLNLMDELNSCLSEELRVDIETNEPRAGVRRPTLQQMLEFDPSEGVHAEDILPLTYQYFDVVDRKDYGGTFMRPFFTGILDNFDFSNNRDQTIGRLIVLFETIAMRFGLIPHSHTRVVARRRAVVRPPLSKTERERINYEDWPGLPD